MPRKKKNEVALPKTEVNKRAENLVRAKEIIASEITAIILESMISTPINAETENEMIEKLLSLIEDALIKTISDLPEIVMGTLAVSGEKLMSFFNDASSGKTSDAPIQDVYAAAEGENNA